MALACQPSFAAQSLLQTPVALRTVTDLLPGDLTLAQLVAYPPRGGAPSGTGAALRKARAAFGEHPNGQVPHPADHAKTEVRRALFLRHVYSHSCFAGKEEAQWRVTRRSLVGR